MFYFALLADVAAKILSNTYGPGKTLFRTESVKYKKNAQKRPRQILTMIEIKQKKKHNTSK